MGMVYYFFVVFVVVGVGGYEFIVLLEVEGGLLYKG